MLSNFFRRINEKWKEFPYGRFCSWLNHFLFGDGHIVIESKKPQEHQNTNKHAGTSLSEIVTSFREQSLKWLERIDYSQKKFAEFILPETKRDEIIKHYEEKLFPKLTGNEAEKMKDFINDYKNDGWKIVAHDDCPSPNEKFDMNKGKIVDNGQPRTNLSIAGKVSDFIGRLLG